MIIKALNTFSGILDLSSLERLQESNPFEKYPFRLYMRPGESVEVDDRYYTLTSIRNAIDLGYIEVGNLIGLNLVARLVDLSYSGTVLTKVAGESIGFGDVLYYKTDGKLYMAKADSMSTMLCIGISTANVVANASIIVLVDGIIRNSSKFHFEIGSNVPAYVSDTTFGGIIQSPSETSGHIVQIIGNPIATDVLSFSPDYTYIEIY